jgi:hypothetical protein
MPHKYAVHVCVFRFPSFPINKQWARQLAPKTGMKMPAQSSKRAPRRKELGDQTFSCVTAKVNDNKSVITPKESVKKREKLC